MSKKNIIIIVVAIVLIIIELIFMNSNNNGERTKSNNVEVEITPIADKKTNKTYEIYNTDIVANTGSTIITATIKNVSKDRTEERLIDVILLNKKGNELGTIKMAVPSLEKNQSIEISAESLKEYKDIYDFKIK